MSKVPQFNEDPLANMPAKKVGHKAKSKKSGKFPQTLQNSDATGKGAQTKQFKKLSMA